MISINLVMGEEREFLLKEAFLLYSINGSNVPVSQIPLVFRQIGIYLEEEEMNETINQMNSDNGQVSFEVFLQVLKTKINSIEKESELECVFKFLDQDRDGFISEFDIKMATRKLGESLESKDVEHLLKAVKSSRISLSQFIDIFADKKQRNKEQKK